MLGIFKTVGKLAVLKILGALIGLLYSVLQVRYFGANGIVDAYFVATAALYLITSLTQGGQLAEVFLLEYLQQKESYGISAASLLLSAIINRISALLAILLLVLYYLAPWIIQLMGPGLESANRALSIELFQISLVLILFNIIASFINTALNAEEIYGRAEITALINSSVSITLLIVFHEQFGIWILIYSLLAGKIIEFFVGIYFLKKIGFDYSFTYKIKGYDFGSFFRVLYSTSGYVGATQVYNIVLTALGSLLPEGSLSIFNYVKQLSNRSRNIVAIPVNTVFFSKFSLKVSRGEKNLSKYLHLPVLGLGLFGLLQICLVISAGQPLLKVLWKESSLTSSEFYLAYVMFILSITGFAFSMVGGIFRKSVVAMNGASKLYLFWTLVQLTTALYSYAAISLFEVWGLATIPFFNMILLSGTSIWVAKTNDIGLKSLVTTKYHVKLGVFMIWSLLFSVLISEIPLEDFSLYSHLILKSTVFLSAFVFSFFILFQVQFVAFIRKFLLKQ